jgi:uncharacterized phage protein gp47/JayE
LSSIVKINGIARKVPTSSTATVSLVGTAGTVVQNAYISDNLSLNSQWFIVGPVIIPPSGVIDTVAICSTQGAVVAAPNTLTDIITPIPGWQTVTNPSAAVVGQPVETDAQLRRRQTQSTSIPAQTVVSSIQGNLMALPSVVRSKVYENDTFVTDANGIPARSIACVVDGTDPMAIATSIANTKTPGVPTYGNITENVIDSKGVVNHINYFQLVNYEIYVLCYITPTVGYTTQTGLFIFAAIQQYVNNLDIGNSVLLGDLYSPANLDGDAAIEATGLNQVQLDPLGASYSVNAPYGLALARNDMRVTGGPYTENSVDVQNGGLYYVNEVVWVTIVSGVVMQTIISAINGNTLVFNDSIPASESVTDGALIYGVADVVAIPFYGAAVISSTSQISLGIGNSLVAGPG